MRQGEDCSGVSQAQRDDLRRRDCVGAAASGASIVLAGAIRRRSAVPVARDAARSGYTSSLMAAVLAVAATVTSVIPASADNRNVPQFPTAWQSKLDTSHPLVGRIWSRAANGFVSAQDYGTALAKSRFILLGEVHEGQQRVRGRVPHADHEGGASGEALPVGAQHIGQRSDDGAARLEFAARVQVAKAPAEGARQRVR